ncbi:sigma-54-dependent Fis family transcriptional regulator [Sphingobium phenoxybenzoativorans]|uniref:Sigma-54-dependent Fis family transcriptional regulator n=1 Tax=Sphingobium phenoxybenzoativorans TaxID=1592790 RepID=A0A975K6R2_9SPHN|nr:sigma-54 dependent transcriptional regulator [Sphingobium phenoxybenzoativorans]QUT05828.1 sigma-54-dependent Fis family transcriptional regulator [Sphingobium phenoxybenzoativorans]
MSMLDMSLSVCRLVPSLKLWLENALIEVGTVDAASPREKGDIRILLMTEIAHATHRDILIDYRDGAPSYHAAANGFPARIAFGIDDAGLGMALVTELVRPAGMPAVGDEASAKLMRLATRIAKSDATALIQGDTGTGKEGMARFLHAQSNRAEKDFIAVNCAALPETMMEAMLFGHRKGSFTGAAAASDGLFLAADGGTLFLDEIAELPLALQAKLLRALQEGEILPVGATHPVPVNVRVIAACNRDLAAECEMGRFRSDLYWRLNVMPLELRPLAERRRDISAISANLLLRHFAQMGTQDAFPWPTAEAMDRLTAHSWPGNARELGNVLQRAMVLREGARIDTGDLNIAGPVTTTMAPASNDSAPVRLADVARMSKIDAIRHALRETDGHKAMAARKLGISERTLRYRLAEMRELAAA